MASLIPTVIPTHTETEPSALYLPPNLTATAVRPGAITYPPSASPDVAWASRAFAVQYLPGTGALD
ncbi:MAG: hypothetical protein ACYDC5_07845 [Candidatus Dormibacteria bacterium]